MEIGSPLKLRWFFGFLQEKSSIFYHYGHHHEEVTTIQNLIKEDSQVNFEDLRFNLLNILELDFCKFLVSTKV